MSERKNPSPKERASGRLIDQRIREQGDWREETLAACGR